MKLNYHETRTTFHSLHNSFPFTVDANPFYCKSVCGHYLSYLSKAFTMIYANRKKINTLKVEKKTAANLKPAPFHTTLFQ